MASDEINEYDDERKNSTKMSSKINISERQRQTLIEVVEDICGEEVKQVTLVLLNSEEETTDEIKEENPKDNVKAEINMELVGSRITVTRKETRQIRDYENNTYSVSISRPVETVTRDEINELQNLAKEVIGEQKKEDGVEDK